MTISLKKTISNRYSLLIFLILTLFICAIFFCIKYSKVNNLTANIKQLTALKEDYSSIDSCIIVLYNADNNARFYAVTGEKSYLKKYSSDINFVSRILNNNKNAADHNEKSKPKNLSGLVVQKRMRAQLNLKLRQLTDSLINSSSGIDTSTQNKNYNSLPLENMNNHFRSLYAESDRLKKNEIVILQLNANVIKEIIALLQRYKSKEIDFANENKAELKVEIDQSFKSINKILVLSLILLISLILAISYILWKIFKNEGELINHSQQAAQYANSKSRFLANMSHEIRTPLNSVIGFSEQLSQGELSGQQLEQVSAIRSSSIMLLDVVNDILDFSKYETGKVSFDHISFVPFDAISDVFNSIKIQATNKGITLRSEVSFKNNFCFLGDSLRLKQVIINLLSNAIKFTDKGSVTLRADVVYATKKQSVLKIQIIDTGIGIGNEDIDMIFDEFAQVYYSSTKIKQKGTGLGLAICKRIVEFQGGTISVTSELGKGSIFSFEIPYEVDAINLALKNEIKINEKINGLEGMRILLADDNKMNILLAQTVLKKYKIFSDAAYDGKEAYELFKIKQYDLILTDIQMPEMGGIEFTRLVREDEDKLKAHITILGVTANVLEEDRKKYIESGIDDLVLKPFSERELIDKIAYYLR